MKKVTVKTDLLKKALPKLGATVNNKTLPALENIYCHAHNGSLNLTTTDLEMTIKYSILCNTEDECEFLLPFHLFSSIVKMCTTEEMFFEVQAKAVKVFSGVDLFTLSYNSKIEDFPKLKDIPNKNSIPFDDSYIADISAATESIGSDYCRPQLSRVLLEIKKDELCVVSTNAFLLYRYTVTSKSETETQLLLSSRMVKAIEGLKQINIQWDDEKFAFQTPEIIIVITRPDFKYVNYTPIIPKNEVNMKVNKGLLMDGFQKLNLASDSYKDVDLSLTETVIKATTDDKKTGLKVNVEIPCQYAGNVSSVTLNTTNMLRLLHQVKCEAIALAISDSKKAILVKGEDENYTGLIIPSQKL